MRPGPKPLVLEGLRLGAGHAWPIEKVHGHSHRSMWRWQCECGNTFTAPPDQVAKEKFKSCGCVKRAVSAKSIAEQNKAGVGAAARWDRYRSLRNNPLGRLFVPLGVSRSVARQPGKRKVIVFHD